VLQQQPAYYWECKVVLGEMEKKDPVEVGREKTQAGLAHDPSSPGLAAFSSC